MGKNRPKRDPLERIFCFPPIYNEDCRIIILSTMPGEESLFQENYYAHPKNLFWDYMYRILQPDYDHWQPFDTTIPFPERHELLLRNKVAVWDVLSDCLRDGANDSKITDAKFNNIVDFVMGTKIEVIFCNGGPALNYLKESGALDKLKVPVIQLGSSSTSNQNNPFKTLRHWRDSLSPYLEKV